jgi:hypothetical protein
LAIIPVVALLNVGAIARSLGRNRSSGGNVAVGTGITPRPPRRSVRAELPHTALASGTDDQPPTNVSDSRGRDVSKLACSGSRSGASDTTSPSPWLAAFPPPPPPSRELHPQPCSAASSVLRRDPTSRTVGS